MDAGSLGRVAAAHATLVDAAAAHVVTSKALDSAIGRMLEPIAETARPVGESVAVKEPVRPGLLARMRGTTHGQASARLEAEAAATTRRTPYDLLQGDVASLPDDLRSHALDALIELRGATYAHGNSSGPVVAARKAALEAIDALRLPEAEAEGLKDRLKDVRPVQLSRLQLETPGKYDIGIDSYEGDLRTVVDDWHASVRANLSGASQETKPPKLSWGNRRWDKKIEYRNGAEHSLADALGVLRPKVAADIRGLSGLADGSAHDLTRITRTLADATAARTKAARAFDADSFIRYKEITESSLRAGLAERGTFEARVSAAG